MQIIIFTELATIKKGKQFVLTAIVFYWSWQLFLPIVHIRFTLRLHFMVRRRTWLQKITVGMGCDVHFKVIYPKYSKHWHYTVAYTIDCVSSKMLNHGLNHGIFLSLFKHIPCPINWIVYVLVSFELFGALYMYISDSLKGI